MLGVAASEDEDRRLEYKASARALTPTGEALPQRHSRVGSGPLRASGHPGLAICPLLRQQGLRAQRQEERPGALEVRLPTHDRLLVFCGHL